eukprot:CAMPEP_0114425804 /NCGR_PEP_ID=MMETSP0103-20121206/7436_1 /TAXON_ID=37642 ORGANISM="Paraphysomonas imperforata, Strain PA2" /NCGR_SAMPLE_ID=MMETSP0103 /ASSEMBLY_ACC=CAM_ASM_000201 /LENGTH=1358 /DNA_ID=CAMNT_0001594675 /DNA_START=219 /DNA_END=4292 /DNA_ORIENTATION=+
MKLQRAFTEKHTLLGEIQKLKEALRRVAKDHHEGIDTALSDQLSRNLSGHFQSQESSPVPHSTPDHSRPSSRNASQQKTQHGSSSSSSMAVSEMALRQQHDRDLQLLLNESIRAATRTCIWVFRCQITKSLAKAFHLWCRFAGSSSSRSAPRGREPSPTTSPPSAIASYASYSSALKRTAAAAAAAIPNNNNNDNPVSSRRSSKTNEKTESAPHTGSATRNGATRRPAATRALPPAATGLRIHTDQAKFPLPLSPPSAGSGDRDRRRGTLSRLGSSASNECSDLSQSDQAVQDLLNSSIVSATDSMHDEKRSLLLSAAKSIIDHKTSPTNARLSPRQQLQQQQQQGRRSLSPSYMRPTVSSSAPTAPTSPPASMLFETYTENEYKNEKSEAIIENAVRIARLRVKEYNQKIRSLSMDERASKSKEHDPSDLVDPYEPTAPAPQPYQRDVKRNYMSNTVVLPKPKAVAALASSSPTRSRSSCSPSRASDSPKMNKNRKNVRVPSVHDVHDEFDTSHYNGEGARPGNSFPVRRGQLVVNTAAEREQEARGRTRYRHGEGGAVHGVGVGSKKGPHRLSESPANKASPIRKQDSISPETVFRNHATLNKVVTNSSPPGTQPGYDIHILNTRTRSRHNSFSFEDISPSPGARERDRKQSIDESLKKQQSSHPHESDHHLPHEQPSSRYHQPPLREEQPPQPPQHNTLDHGTSAGHGGGGGAGVVPQPRTVSSASHNSNYDLSLLSQKLSPVRDHLLSPQQRQRRRPPVSPHYSSASGTTSHQPTAEPTSSQMGADISRRKSSSGSASRRSRSSHLDGESLQRQSVSSRSHSVGATSNSVRSRGQSHMYVSAESSLTGDVTHGGSRNRHTQPHPNSAPEESAVSTSFEFEVEEGSLRGTDDVVYEYSVTDVPETGSQPGSQRGSQRGSLANGREPSSGQGKVKGKVSNRVDKGYLTDGERSAGSYHQSNRSIYDIMRANYVPGPGLEYSVEDALNGLSDSYVSPYSQASSHRRGNGNRSGDRAGSGRRAGASGGGGKRGGEGRMMHPYTRQQEAQERRPLHSARGHHSDDDRNARGRSRSRSNNHSDHAQDRARPKDGGRSPDGSRKRQSSGERGYSERHSYSGQTKSSRRGDGNGYNYNLDNGYWDEDGHNPATPYVNGSSGARHSRGGYSDPGTYPSSGSGVKGRDKARYDNDRGGRPGAGSSEYHRANVRHAERRRLAETLLQQEQASEGLGLDSMIPHMRSYDTQETMEDGFGIKRFQQQQRQEYARAEGRQSTSALPSDRNGYSRAKTQDSYYSQRKSMSVVEQRSMKIKYSNRNENNNINSSSSKLNYRYRQKPMSKAQYQLIFGKLDDVRSAKSTHW